MTYGTVRCRKQDIESDPSDVIAPKPRAFRSRPATWRKGRRGYRWLWLWSWSWPADALPRVSLPTDTMAVKERPSLPTGLGDGSSAQCSVHTSRAGGKRKGQ